MDFRDFILAIMAYFIVSLVQKRQEHLVVKVYINIAHGIIGAVVVSIFCSWHAGNFGEARHTLSIIGAIAIGIASLYLLRSRWIRWGNRQRWLRYHQRIASFGLCLVLIHSAFQPLLWHSWLTFLLALSNLGTGIAVSLTKRRARRLLLRCHLILAPILLISIIFHGQQKLEHDEFFPLTDVHDVPCVRCHTSEPLLFHVDASLQQELDMSKTVPDDIHWWLSQHGVDIPQTSPVSIKTVGRSWKIEAGNRAYHISAREERAPLGIYADSAYRSYTCIACHVHNTPEIRQAHELHGVADYHRCFVCHQTEIDGKLYGRQRVNWEYDQNW